MIRKIIFTFSILFLALHLSAQENIHDARTNYNVGQIVTVTGVVTNGSELGPIRYIQDGTAGIAIYPAANWGNLPFIPQPGDEITVTGELTEFASLLEVGPNITSLTLVSTGNPLPDYLELTPNQLQEAYEGMRVKVNNVSFNDGGGTFGNTTYSFTSEDGQQGVVFINANTAIMGQMIPMGPIEIKGILSQHSYNNPNVGYQILPLNMNAFISSSAININSAVNQTNLSHSSITLDWTTNVDGSTGVFYGTTPDFGQILYVDESTINHQITIDNLDPGTPYYVRVFSTLETDTAKSNTGVYSTVSNSPGTITVYFNREVNTDYSTGVDAISLFGATADTIIAQLDRATETIDVAAYNVNNQDIVFALNAAYTRGVDVRYIAEGQNANLGLQFLNFDIPRIYRQDATSSGMHNKFIIIDANREDSALVITGSTNFTNGNLFSDANNLVLINDQALARAYTLEFNEMWGSDGMQPNTAASRFGEFKTKNTPEKFLIGGVPVELYFSPTDNTTNAIKNAIETTDYNLDFALLNITHDLLANAVADQVSSTVTPRGIIQHTTTSGSDYQFLIDQGAIMMSLSGTDHSLHHKYAIIDHSNPESDPIVVTGSHNWSASAETTNDENTLIIHDATVANLFYQEFMALYGIATNVEKEIELKHVTVYPNPAKDFFTMVFDAPRSLKGEVRITDLQGKVIYQKDFNSFAGQNNMEFYIGSLTKGMYMVTLSGEWGNTTQKLLKM